MVNSELERIKRKFGIVGNDKVLNSTIEVAMQVAPVPVSVLIHGENGTGKESYSKIIHALSPQKHNKLIAVNCGSIPEGTIDSELFGHEKGSFTGAIETRKGYFEEANQGTIFLDEIGEMPLNTQTKLLRILEYGEFLKVGSSKVHKTQTRIIAATNVNLIEAIQKGKFREDLYYRINTIPIQIPPLRKRGTDILLLFKKFAGDFADQHHTQPLQLTTEAEKTLLNYPFPGNIRELKNLVMQLSVLEYQKRTITAEKLLSYLPAPNHSLVALQHKKTPTSLSERKILYKLLFDMQRDLQDLKKLLFQQLKKDTMGPQLIKAYPTLFSRLPENSLTQNQTPKITHSNTPPATLPKNTTTSVVKLLQEENQEPKDEKLRVEDVQKDLLIKALKKSGNNPKLAAELMGRSERTVYRMIKKYNLQN